MGRLFRLLIPRKSSDKVPDLDTNWRAIERWAQNVGGITEITSKDNSVTITDPFGPVTDLAALGSGSYASLTGPGKTTTPGDLTQAGGFTVNDSHGHGITFTSSGGSITGTATNGIVTFKSINNSTTAFGELVAQQNGAQLIANDSASNEVAVVVADTGPTAYLQIFQSNFTAGVRVLGGNTSFFVARTGPAATPVFEVRNGVSAGLIGFFGSTPVLQQGGGSITTVAQLVAVLQLYGLLS